MKNKKNQIFTFLIMAALLFLFMRTALYDDLVVRKYPIYTTLVSEPHTFVLLTDLHSTEYGSGQRRLLGIIDKYSPEAVFLVGDIADDKRDFYGTSILLDGLGGRFPCYYVTGNHERWVEYTDDIKGLVGSYGIKVLDDTLSPVILGDGEIRLFGMDDPLFYENTEAYLTRVMELDVSDETFDLLLAHRPEFYKEYLTAGLDLTLCGHAHGGQIRIPLLLNGLYAPNQGYFPEYAGGLYESEDNRFMIVSRGLMKDNIPRVFNPPEVCVIQIFPEQQKS